MKVLAAFLFVAVACEVSALPRRRRDEPPSVGGGLEKIAKDATEAILNSPPVQRIEAEIHGAQSAVDSAHSAVNASVGVARAVNDLVTNGSRLAVKVVDKGTDLGLNVGQRVADGSASLAHKGIDMVPSAARAVGLQAVPAVASHVAHHIVDGANAVATGAVDIGQSVRNGTVKIIRDGISAGHDAIDKTLNGVQKVADGVAEVASVPLDVAENVVKAGKDVVRGTVQKGVDRIISIGERIDNLLG